MNYYNELPVFERLAEHYFIPERMSLGLSHLWRKWVLKYVQLKPGNKVLDMMCGDGKLWPNILRKIGENGQLTGLDFCQEMLEKNEYATKENTECIAFQESQLPANSQHNIISTFGIKHLEKSDIETLMLQIEKLLVPGGTYALLELKMPKNRIFKALVHVQLAIFSFIAQVFCPSKKCSVSYLKKSMTTFSKTNYTIFYSNKTLTTQIKHIFGGLLVVVYGRKI